MSLKAYRAAILHCLGDPGLTLPANNIEYFADGILIIENGYVQQVGEAATLLAQLPHACELIEYPQHLIIPGLIDLHIHYPQTDMIAAYGEQLLPWLEQYTFPTEREFADALHAQAVAQFFLDELMRNGTTSAVVYGTVHPQSVEALFEQAYQRNLRLIAGKVMMDCHCPPYLQDTAESSYAQSKALIEKWQGKGRLAYAVTPRFAPTSSEAQLQQAQRLLAEYPEVYLQTHLAENKQEVAWVHSLFPKARSYLAVYEHYQFVKPRSIFAHCIYLDQHDKQTMAKQGASAAFCASSNLFMGSGLFDLHAAKSAGIRVGLGTDVGAGTSFNLLQTYQDAYKVTQLLEHNLSAFQGLYLATLGAAHALYIEDKVGNFSAGKEADFVVLDLAATPLLQRRLQHTNSLHEQLFALMMLADNRVISATYIMGEVAYCK
jgi:guanine deaminase